MSRIVVIGATGHVGTYLVPRLVRAGHQVVALSRGAREPYLPAPEWHRVERVLVDREAEDAAGRFGERGEPRARRPRHRREHRPGDVLGYRPRYSSLDALHEALRWLTANGHVDVGDQEF
jgi:nucleoside-diphosphate-sugar epimerase